MGGLSSRLDAVTVFREGALCKRVAEVPAQAERDVRLVGLPLSLEAGSFRARVVGDANRVVDVRAQFDVEFIDETNVAAEVKALESAKAKLAELQLERNRVGAEIAELQALAPAFLEQKRGEPPRPAPVDAMIALGDFKQAELDVRLAQRRTLDEAIRDANEELALRNRRLQEASTAKRTERSKLSRAAVVTLAEAPKAPLTLELEYRVAGARWVPSYSLTLERGASGGALSMRASIAQQTGEDWAGVALSLSTASASRRADMPELKALKIGRRQEEPQRSGWREPPPGLDGLFEAYDAATTVPPPAKPRPMPASTTVATEKGAAYQYGPPMDLASNMAPPAPPPPPVQRAPSRPGGPPMAAPAMSMPVGGAVPMPQARRATGSFAAPAPEMAPAPKSAGFGGLMRSRGGGGKDMKKEAREEEQAEAPAYDELDGFAGGDEGGAMGDLLGADDQPVAGPGAQFGDYARLVMPAFDRGGPRGKLASASEWDFAFIAGVSVQIDVVMAVVARAQALASSVHSLPLPALCNPVTSVRSFDYRYDCAGKLDVPSTGKWVLVPVMKCAVGLTPEYVCVPSVEQKVYRTLTIANKSQHALLPGPVDVTAGDEFLMTTSLPAIPPHAELPSASGHRLGLGVEEAIKVARKTQFKETSGGFLGGSTVLPHDIEIELNNRLGTPALVEVRERVPVLDPSEKDLKVEEVQVTPPWETPKDNLFDETLVRGGRRWRVTVAPGQSMKLSAQFAIRMPSDRMLNGGNRRN